MADAGQRHHLDRPDSMTLPRTTMRRLGAGKLWRYGRKPYRQRVHP